MTMRTHYPIVRVKLDDGAHIPTRSHDTDAGADIRCREDFTLPASHVDADGRVIIGSATIDTGVHVELPPNTKGEVMARSGLNINHDIITTGLIDEGFTGEIRVKLYNLGETDYRFDAGDRIAQLVVSPVHYPTYIEAESIGGGERGESGYGSTGR